MSAEVGGDRWRSVAEVGSGRWRSKEVCRGRWRLVAEVGGGGRWRSVEVDVRVGISCGVVVEVWS